MWKAYVLACYFSIKQLSNQVDEITSVIRSILEISVDDGIEWKEIEGSPLNHPEMEQPGVRLGCRFLLGKMKGVVRMDMALGWEHFLKREKMTEAPLRIREIIDKGNAYLQKLYVS